LTQEESHLIKILDVSKHGIGLDENWYGMARRERFWL